MFGCIIIIPYLQADVNNHKQPREMLMQANLGALSVIQFQKGMLTLRRTPQCLIGIVRNGLQVHIESDHSVLIYLRNIPVHSQHLRHFNMLMIHSASVSVSRMLMIR